NWSNDGAEIKEGICQRYPYLNGNPNYVAKNTDFYFRPGFIYTSYTILGFGLRYLPRGVVFSVAGMGMFGAEEATLALLNSRAVQSLLNLISDGRKWEAGVVQRIPVPRIPESTSAKLGDLARRAWSLKRA